VRGVLQARTLSDRTDDELLKLMLELGAEKALVAEHKTMVAPEAPPDAGTGMDAGTFSGYLAAYVRDLQGDTLEHGAMDESLAEWKAGRIRWLLTDAHSDRASDVVAEVTAADLDSHGLRVTAKWLPTGRAQMLRAMAKAGIPLGLSIDYFADQSYPDGIGGRVLTAVRIVGGAITPKPANPLARIFEGKAAAPVAGVVVDQDTVELAQLEQWAEESSARRDLSFLAGLPSEVWRGVADTLEAQEAKALEADLLAWAASPEVAAAVHRDPGVEAAELVKRRWDQANEYGLDLYMWKAAHR
jgi:HK97 family phage prohead protease